MMQNNEPEYDGGVIVARDGRTYFPVLINLDDVTAIDSCDKCEFLKTPPEKAYGVKLTPECKKIGDFCITQQGKAVRFELDPTVPPQTPPDETYWIR